MGHVKAGGKHSKEDLLAAGLKILAEHGEGALTIETLCTMLGVTKGSFYHHFTSREDYSGALLEYWEKEYTNRFIDACGKEKTAWDSVCSLDAMVLGIDDAVEVSVRAWSLRDTQARSFQQRIDGVRMDYLRKLYAELVGDAAAASRLAQLEYAAFIGLRLMTPHLDKQRIAELIQQWNDLVACYAKGGAS